MLKPEYFADELNKTPELKRRLVLRIVEDLLDSEAFLEAYPRLYDPSVASIDPEYANDACLEMAQIIVRLFRKNKVRQDDAKRVLEWARDDYLGI